jgi:hypothetical protein
MPFVILLIGAILIITAFNNSFSALATQLESDIPAYFKWAAAIVAILGIGYIPGLRTPSRYLLGLVLLVILLTNYQQILSGLQTFFTSGGTATAGVGASTATPSASYTATYAPAAASGTTTQGTTSAGTVAAATQTLTAAQQLAANPLNPNAYVGLAAGFGGLA